MTAQRENDELDLILSTRLDLLEQAVKEADKIVEAMDDQRRRLKVVGDSLGPKGRLSASENRTRTAVEDAITRLSMVLTGRPRATPEELEREELQDLDDQDIRGERDRTQVDGESDEEDRRQITDAFVILWKARPYFDQLVADRTDAHTTFQSVSRWSVAALTNEGLNQATSDYSQLLAEIRRAPNPWRRYEDELRGRGQMLYTRYLELLGGMAIRGLGLGDRDSSDVQSLMKHLLTPLGREAQSALPPPALYVPMGTRHAPLGYSSWGVWALPLVGRTVGEYLIDKGVFKTDMHRDLVVACADIYALYALGPGYAHAAIFLDLDPDTDATNPGSDAFRAEVLLAMLPRLDESSSQELERIARDIAGPWRAARKAVQRPDSPLNAADKAVIGGFLAELQKEYAGLAYDLRFLNDARVNGQKLAQGGAALENLVLQIRDLITAVWLARLQTPEKAQDLHKNAKIVSRPRAGGTRPLDPGRTSMQRMGV